MHEQFISYLLNEWSRLNTTLLNVQFVWENILKYVPSSFCFKIGF